ncbi:TonB-dependent receptor [Adhaeribacter swui]|uniref:TonB-dependent receptor n=1 Tax=Adhaeribacter swui TaxID=2086471 RepID=A0A7G7G8N5_9BACT|nr:TonB-dependent receptor [Adhaeribacter swui]QNF33519.1 TonB-dependent receptor [Adhaeribacter swui]
MCWSEPPGKALLVFWISCILILGVQSNTFAQQKTVTGTVKDERSAPIPGVTVLVKGASKGTTTDVSGKFNLQVSPDEVLVFSIIGYVSREVPVGNRTTIDVNMSEDMQNLSEVVIVGFGAEKKVNVIGSIETISTKEIKASPVGSVSNALAGRLPGLVVQQPQGEPGADAAQLLIRGRGTLGNSAPLIIIDGTEGRDINALNANDIESISVLKDASAAIYGARAANGVILVTTKKGAQGKPRIDYSMYQGLSKPTWLPKMTDAATYAQMVREMQTYDGVAEANLRYKPEDVEKYRSGEYPWTHPNTNWNDVTLRNFANTSNHNLSISGGTDRVTYYGGIGYFHSDGIYKRDANDFKRFNIKVNVDFNVNKYLTVGVALNEIQENRMSSSMDRETIFNVVNQGRPTDFAYWPNGQLATGSFGLGYHPAVISTLDYGFNDRKNLMSYNTLNASLKIPGVEGLALTTYYSYDVDFNKGKLFTQPLEGYTFNRAAYLAAGNTGKEDGSAFLTKISNNAPRTLENTNGNATRKLYHLQLDYAKTFNEAHNLSAFVAYEQFKNETNSTSAFRTGFVSSALPYLFAGGNQNKDNYETVGIDTRVNYFGRLSYNYKEKYLLQFTLRRDGSVRFSEESGRWGTFPSALAGWVISKEGFMQDKFVNFLKLKASWGRMGNDQVDPFQYLASYSFGTGGVYGTGLNYSNSLFQNVTPNPNITWEIANMTNVGFESAFFNDFFLNADFFYQRRSRILVARNASVPDFTGISLPNENFGIVDSKGLEVELGYQKGKSDVTYGITGNFTFARNKIVEFDEPKQVVEWQRRTGHPIGAILLHKSAGIFKNVDQVNSMPHVTGAIPGDVIIEDVNGDGQITADDRILFDQTSVPEITYAASLNVGYKAFRLSALITGVGTAWRQMLGSQQGLQGNYYQYQADGRWTPDNPNATKPRTPNGWQPYWRNNSFRTDMEYQNMEFARLKNVELSYTLPKKFQNTLKMANAEIYLSGQNLFLLYASQGIWDPEFSGNRDNYPIMKVYTIGARVSF